MLHRRDRSGAVELQLAESGVGEPTVLVVPGFGSGLDAYECLIDALSADRRVVALSVRGFGTSGWAAPYSIGDWVDDVVHVAGTVERGPVVAVGHSFGAILALAAAGMEPGLIDAVISLDQVVDIHAFAKLAHGIIPYWRDVRGAIERAGGDADLLADLLGDLVPASERHRVASSWAPQDPAVFDSIVPDRFDEWALDPSVTDLPGKFRGPVLFIDGDPDAGSIVGPELALRNMALYPWAQRVQLRGVGHGLHLETEPTAVVDAVNEFVNEGWRARCQ